MANSGSSIRWQAICITQFGVAVSLFLGFATASLGFSLLLLRDPDFHPDCLAKIGWIISVVFLTLSIISGSGCVVNRLHDFRLTARIARKRENGENEASLESLRQEADKLGENSWKLFYW